MLCQLGVIADDLTGASDTGVQFSKQGLRTLVLLDPATAAPITTGEPIDILVIDTDTRFLTPDEAYDRVRRSAQILAELGIRRIYKKIDSTLRGNLGRELDAIMDVLCVPVGLVAPAFPANQRTTINGYQLWNDIPLPQTEVGADPITPVTESHIPTLLASQSRRQVGHVGLDMVSEEARLEAALREAIQRGDQIVVFDAITQEHLTNIARVAVKLGLAALTCGSAGLALELPRALGLHGPFHINRPSVGLPVVVVAGSTSHVTRAQIEYVVKGRQSEVVSIDVAGVIAHMDDTVEQAVTEAVRAAISGKDVIIVPRPPDDALLPELATSTETRVRLEESKGFVQESRAIVAALGRIASGLLKTVRVAGMILTGGDTSMGVLKELGAVGLAVGDEIEPGIPFGRVVGGDYDGMIVVTKAGSFGGDAAIAEAISFCRGAMAGATSK